VSDRLVRPEVDANCGLVLEPGEQVRYRGSHSIGVTRIADSGRGAERVLAPSPSAEVTITTRRVAYVWSNLRGDRRAGSLLERRVILPLMEREMGKIVSGGQVRHQWISRVSAGSPQGIRRKHSGLGISLELGDRTHYFNLIDLDASDTPSVAQRLAADVARHRLENRPDPQKPLRIRATGRRQTSTSHVSADNMRRMGVL
jgi:hypothetical protein